MHEESLVRSLLDQVRGLAAAHGASAVALVTVDVGRFSGVEPELFRLAFERLAPAQLGDECRLQLRRVPLAMHCSHCDADYQTDDVDFFCPHCASPKVDVRGGDSVILESVTLATDQRPASASESATVGALP